MESHVLNTYHQARYRTIGHKRMGSTSESLSSESSCNQNSPDYSQAQPEYADTNGYEEESNEEYWNHTVNTTQTSQDSSSEEEENVDVVELDHQLDENSEDTLVEGDDYDVIQVFAVDPNLDLEVSSDEDQSEPDYAINEDADNSEEEDYAVCPETYREETQYEYQENRSDMCQDALDINLDGPVVSNVDEYFIKEKPKPILDVNEEPVVKDVDEYFIKDVKPVLAGPEVPNVDDFFIKEKTPEVTKTQSDIVQNVPQVEEVPPPVDVKDPELNEPGHIAEVSINESDLDVLPKIEEIKKFLLADIPYRFKNTQRSCSVPHSPMHHVSCVDIDDAKTCLSFEDLNLDLSDLAFDNDKDKSDSASKIEYIPRTLTDEDVNSFLITSKSEQKIEKHYDDLSTQDMEIDDPVESTIDTITAQPTRTSTPNSNVLDFCIEKPVTTPVKLVVGDVKVEMDDFVDVESCNDAAIPVLAANNLNSLLEQFEANEKFATKPKRPVVKEEPKAKPNGLTNGMRLQDAGVQLNKNKMRQILMPPTKNTALRRSPSPVHSDHDYCSTKKRHSLPALRGGQSLLKPEVLSSNSRILNSRHRSCKNKKIVYHLSSDDESDKCVKIKKLSPRASDDSDVKAKKSTLKQPIKPPTPSNCRKKLSPPHSANYTCKDKINNSVMVKNASKASDTLSSQTNISIKLTIKNKSEVILNNCDDKGYQRDVKDIEKCTSSVSNKILNAETVKGIQELDSEKNKCVNISDNNCVSENVKTEPRPKEENFYTALFSNKQDVQVPLTVDIKTEKRPIDDEVKSTIDVTIKNEMEQPQKKKKLNLQEYKMRRSVTSNNSSAAVSPEAIFPDLPSPCLLEKVTINSIITTPPNETINATEQKNPEAPKKFFDPIREASRKILMNTKKQKAEATRKRDEDIVMSKIPKVENLELQPLISDAEMLKIVGGMAPEEVPTAIIKNEKPKGTDYEELVLVSVGTNTEEKFFRQMEKTKRREFRKSQTPPMDAKALINFKIKKSEAVLKQNVFDAMRKEKRSPDDKRHPDVKIDKERYKDITAALKSVEKQVDTKISSNSLFASIQDVVLKKAPEEPVEKQIQQAPTSRSNKPAKTYKTTIVREYDTKAEHGEDKIILHLGKDRRKPEATNVTVQTEIEHQTVVAQPTKRAATMESSPVQRKRNDSDMSLSSDASPPRNDDKSGSADSSLNKSTEVAPKRSRSVEKRSRSVEKRPRSSDKRSRSREKRSRSRDRYDRYRRRSRSHSRRRRRSRSRSVRTRRTRSIDRYRRRRRESPYKRKRTRSPYRRRSPSARREYRNRTRSRSRSRSRHDSARSKSPRKTPPGVEKKCDKSFTPPPRKPTVSESSESSTSSSSSSSSSSSNSSSSRSRQSERSCSPRQEAFRRPGYRSYSPEDRDSNKPVEERRIVFVGKLEKDSTKATLRAQFSKFGHIIEVRLHNKEDGTRYGFVTYSRGREAWSAVEAAAQFPQYDVGFGGRRAFCRQSYADLDGLEAEYTESAFHGAPTAPSRRDDMSFEQMLLDVKQKLSQRKKEDDKP